MRIFLEDIIDSGVYADLDILRDLIYNKRLLSKDGGRLEALMLRLGLTDYLDSLLDTKLEFDDLVTSNFQELQALLKWPAAPFSKLVQAIAELRSAELEELREKLVKLEAEHAKLKDDDPPAYLLCPISHELMQEPVVTADGHTYEKRAIERWLKNHASSPITGLELSNKVLRPNFALKSALQSYMEKRASIQPSTCRNLYETAYGHHLGESILVDLSNTERLELSMKAQELLTQPSCKRSSRRTQSQSGQNIAQRIERLSSLAR
mmetsp:Transcript_15948/g.29199  ORF Transcript_15948/g.29199 Transcript_15948/m.29199 type:complete len:265 (+) Transcript_15948:242-1036(+)